MNGHPGPPTRGSTAETASTRIALKKGGTFFLNGALIRAQDAFGAEIHFAESLLLPSQILSAGAARTPLQQLYYGVQQALIEPGTAGDGRAALTAALHAAPGPVQRDTLERVAALVEAGRLIEALSALRRAIKAESIA